MPPVPVGPLLPGMPFDIIASAQGRSLDNPTPEPNRIGDIVDG